jgi:apolipoprotein D and lipocalin family protein
LIFEYSEGSYAYVTGNSYEYLWLLSRTKVVSKTVIDQFISKANSLGFDTSKLIYNASYFDQKSTLSGEELL